MHPTVIIRGYTLAAEAALDAVRSLAFDVDTADRASMLTVLNACIGTKFTSRFGPLLAELALDAVSIVATPSASGGPPDVDVKRYAKVEKLPGGDVSDCRVLKGVMFNKVGSWGRAFLLSFFLSFPAPSATRPPPPPIPPPRPFTPACVCAWTERDVEGGLGRLFFRPPPFARPPPPPSPLPAQDVVAPGRMARTIRRPRILLLDCPLEYKKGESQTSVELTREEDWAALLKAEEDWVKAQCEAIAALKPTLVVTEKGVSDLAVHHLAKAGIAAVRRVRKTDNNRIARATGATVVHRVDEATEADIGTGAGLFEVVKIGDEFYSFIVDCDAPKACTVLLRGASKDVLNEVERNLADAVGVARNVVRCPRLVPGGGAPEMAASAALTALAASLPGPEAGPVAAVGKALEVIPRTLASNCGANVIRLLTELRAKHAAGVATGSGPCPYGIDGVAGSIADAKAAGVWEPLEVKEATLKTAMGCATLLLRIDDIVSGIRKKGSGGGGPSGPVADDGENVDSEQMLPE
jgi:chaperonin GroEL (HSP60 family)